MNIGSIVLVPFPFTDLSTVKKRPELVMSNTDDNKLSEDLVVCAITSENRKFSYSLVIDSENIENGSLPVQSVILISKLFTIERGLVVNQIGSQMKRHLKKLKKYFVK